MSMKKVLFLNHTGSVMGSETVLLQELDYLSKDENLQLHVIYLKTSHKEFENAIKNIGITYYKRVYYKMIDCGFFRSIIKLILSILSLFQIITYIKKNKIDIVYSNTIINIFGIITAILTKKRHIWHFHEEPYEGYPWINSLFLGLYRCLLKYKKNFIIFISKKQKIVWEQVFGMKLENSIVVFNPLKIIENKIINLDGFAISFGYLGGFIQVRKNIFTLLTCFNRLVSDFPKSNIRLILKGEGPLKEKMGKFIIDNNLSDKVFLENFSNDLTSFFSSINIFVLPSYFESWGLVALEAMSLGKYTIVTKNTAISELLPDGLCTYIDPYSEDSLYDAMKKALTVPPIHHDRIDHFNEIMRDSNIKFYQTIRRIVLNGE